MGRIKRKSLCFRHPHRVPFHRCWDGMEDILLSVSAPISVSLVAPDYGGPGATTLSEPMHRSNDRQVVPVPLTVSNPVGLKSSYVV
jgi:hypothetical protein